MAPDLSSWKPIEVSNIQARLGAFANWCICGGISVDLLVGRKTRDHGDIDIGVFRSQLKTCLNSIGAHTVYLCDPPGSVKPWDGLEVPSHVNDIFITSEDQSVWELQILVYTDDDQYVYFKRNDRIRWKKTTHTLRVKGLDILNPAITMLYKSNKLPIPPKDSQDICFIIDSINNSATADA